MKNTRSLIAIYLACGIDPNKNTIYIQSENIYIPAISWLLECYTYYGEASRMIQFKEKSRENENFTVGLLTYPILMSADILYCDANYVPVGIDQKQHLELTRDVAIRFNNIYGNVFKVPDGFIPKVGGKIMSLQSPTDKMSKSDPDLNGYVAIIDNPDLIMKKFKRAVTDSDNKIVVSPDKAGISNLISIYSIFADCSVEETERRFEGKGYGDFKVAVGEAVVDKLKPVQEKYAYLMQNKDYLNEVLQQGAQKANYLANKTLSKVERKVGLR